MATYRTVQRLAPEMAAYVAGLVDGEGTITLTAQHRGEKRRLVVAISNTDRALLDFVRQAVGAGRITSKRTYKEHHTPSFAYTLSKYPQQVLHLRNTFEKEFLALGPGPRSRPRQS